MNKLDTNSNIFLRQKVTKDVTEKIWPFDKSLVVYMELESYLMALAKQHPDKDIPVATWRLKELYRVLKQLGGIHLRYNATVKGKTVNLNVWVMRDHDLYLAMPRGQLINEWKAQAAA
jgi:hypothetical protein